MTRRPTVIENKDCQFPVISCYNCGSKDHFGEQCTKQTMEGETYQRYGRSNFIQYHLNLALVRVRVPIHFAYFVSTQLPQNLNFYL